MSDKNITEMEWKRFAKGRNFKDADFVKGLADLERAKTPDMQLRALDEIEKQSSLLLKAQKGDKELASYLNETGKAIDKQRRLSEFEVNKAAKDGEGDDGPAALGAAMLPLLRQVAKGKEGGALPVMVAAAGKEVAVLVARRAIGAAQKKLLDEALGHPGGIKYMSGECVWEANAHTFVLEAKVPNLAKGIKAALQKQTDARFKVRVRGSDPHDVDDDGDDPQVEGNVSAEAQAQESPERTQYLEHLGELEPRIETALRGQTREVGKLKAVFEFAKGKAKEGHYASALQGLDAVSKLLAGASAVPQAPPLPPTSTPKPQTVPLQSGDESKQFTLRVNEMLPRVKDGLAVGLQGARGAKFKLSEAATFARKQDWQTANSLLDELDKELALDGMTVPRTLSPEDTQRQEIARKEELAERWRNTVPDTKKLSEMERGMVGSGESPMDRLLQKKFEQLRVQNQTLDFEAAMRIFASIQALTGSTEASRAEVKHMMSMDSPHYQEKLADAFGGQWSEQIDQLRREAAVEGYGLTSDGLVRYALPIKFEEWKRGTQAPLSTISSLVEKAALLSRQNSRDPSAVLPLLREIAGEQYPLIQMIDRVWQYALDGSFTDQGQDEAARALHQSRNDFADAMQPFFLVNEAGTDVDQLLVRIKDLSPTLSDSATLPQGGGNSPMEQLQQVMEDIRKRKFGPASALLMSMRHEIVTSRPRGEPGENLNEQIAIEGDTRVRDLVSEKLYEASKELDVLAAKDGLPFDSVQLAFEKLEKAAKVFETML